MTCRKENATTGKHVVLLAALVIILAGLVVVGNGATTPPLGSAYHWAQPGCANVGTPAAQPPSWIPAFHPVALVTVPGSSYFWAQPGCAPVTTPGAQPPADIPTG